MYCIYLQCLFQLNSLKLFEAVSKLHQNCPSGDLTAPIRLGDLCHNNPTFIPRSEQLRASFFLFFTQLFLTFLVNNHKCNMWKCCLRSAAHEHTGASPFTVVTLRTFIQTLIRAARQTMKSTIRCWKTSASSEYFHNLKHNTLIQ